MPEPISNDLLVAPSGNSKTNSSKLEECSIIIYHGTIQTHRFKIPCYPESITDSQSAVWSDQTIVGRYAPISAYAGVGYRRVNYSFILHRDMMPGPTTIEDILKGLRATQYPRYQGNGVLPPVVIVTCGKFRIYGIMRDYSYSWEKPIINQLYQVCTISLSIDEVPTKQVDALSILGSESNITSI